jgi:hypothetical protein
MPHFSSSKISTSVFGSELHQLAMSQKAEFWPAGTIFWGCVLVHIVSHLLSLPALR